ncbi:MAG: STAS domain-containing protein [Candidatus Eremiobacteraeota bacterium]|nr:STAS domain-containing protein [Candidatus Eremiobacteraeota bacterium]
MKVIKTRDEDTLILEMEDSLESDYAVRMDGRVDGILEGGIKNIIFDMSKSTYIDSTGLRILVKALKRLNKDKGKVVLVDVGEHILHTLDILGMAGFFTIKDTMEEALGELNTSLKE